MCAVSDCVIGSVESSISVKICYDDGEGERMVHFQTRKGLKRGLVSPSSFVSSHLVIN